MQWHKITEYTNAMAQPQNCRPVQKKSSHTVS